jgi:hypothetical protein
MRRSVVGYIGAGVSLEDALDGLLQRKLDPSNMFCVQELCDGGSLRDMVEKQMSTMSARLKAYSASDALEWTLQIAEALTYLHEGRRHVVHRDLKLGAIDLIVAPPAATEVPCYCCLPLALREHPKTNFATLKAPCRRCGASSRQRHALQWRPGCQGLASQKEKNLHCETCGFRPLEANRSYGRAREESPEV